MDDGQHARVKLLARARSRSNAQTQMIAAVGGASTRSTTRENTRRASRISPTNGNQCGV